MTNLWMKLPKFVRFVIRGVGTPILVIGLLPIWLPLWILALIYIEVFDSWERYK